MVTLLVKLNQFNTPSKTDTYTDSDTDTDTDNPPQHHVAVALVLVVVCTAAFPWGRLGELHPAGAVEPGAEVAPAAGAYQWASAIMGARGHYVGAVALQLSCEIHVWATLHIMVGIRRSGQLFSYNASAVRSTPWPPCRLWKHKRGGGGGCSTVLYYLALAWHSGWQLATLSGVGAQEGANQLYCLAVRCSAPIPPTCRLPLSSSFKQGAERGKGHP
jgi:hypothetical protein